MDYLDHVNINIPRVMDTVKFEFTYYPTVFFSFLFFLIVYRYIAPSISQIVSPGYNTLSVSKQVEWNTRCGSSIHAILVSSMCVYTLMFDNDVYNEPIWMDSPLVRSSCAIVIGYLISDTVIMVMMYEHVGEGASIIHHAISIYAYCYPVTYGMCPYFSNYRLMAEFSTPFVNQRWFLYVLNYPKSSSLVFLNGVVMAATFFLARLACMPQFWLRVYAVYGTPSYTRLGHIYYVIVITCFILDVINIFWFFKICRGILKFWALPPHRADQNGDCTKCD